MGTNKNMDIPQSATEVDPTHPVAGGSATDSGGHNLYNHESTAIRAVQHGPVFPHPSGKDYDRMRQVVDTCKPLDSSVTGIAVVRTSPTNYAWSVHYTKTGKSLPDPEDFDLEHARSIFQAHCPYGAVVCQVNSVSVKDLQTRWNVVYKVDVREKTKHSFARRVLSAICCAKKTCPDGYVSIPNYSVRHSVYGSTTTSGVVITSKTSSGEIITSDMNNIDRGNIPQKIFYNGKDVTSSITGRTRFCWRDLDILASGAESRVRPSKRKRTWLSHVVNVVVNKLRQRSDDAEDDYSAVAPPNYSGIDESNRKTRSLALINNMSYVPKIRNYLSTFKDLPISQINEFCFDNEISGVDIPTIMDAIRFRVTGTRTLSHTSHELANSLDVDGVETGEKLWYFYLQRMYRGGGFNEVVEIITSVYATI